jgi:hypothetical protein
MNYKEQHGTNNTTNISPNRSHVWHSYALATSKGPSIKCYVKYQ